MKTDAAIQDNPVRAMRRKIRYTYLISFAVWFGICFGIAFLFGMRKGFDRTETACAFAAVFFFGLIALLVALNIIRTRLDLSIKNSTELIPTGADEETVREWLRSDAIYLEQIGAMNRERKSLITLGILLSLFLPLFFILAEINYRNRIRALGLHPGTPVAALRRFSEKRERGYGWTGFFILLFCVFMILFSSMLAFVGKSKVHTLNTEAKCIYNAAVNYQTDLDYADQDTHLRTVIINGQMPGDETEFHEGICGYYSDASRLWYAVICDENGQITDAMCAKRPITEEDLAHPQTYDEQLAYMSSMFQQKQTVGYYHPVPAREE